MKGIITGFILMGTLFVQAKEKYTFHLNLNEPKEDRLQVRLVAPKINQEKVVYNIPKIVPGTYSEYNFGQYIKELEATNSKGERLKVLRLDSNRWEIEGATALHEITYWVEDTWDAETDNFVFEPAGTNIEKDNFVLNNHGFFGYFDGMKSFPYELLVTHPETFYGSTGMQKIVVEKTVDKFATKNYMDLVDAPIMYNVPDTITINVGEVEILVSVYSENKTVSAKDLSGDIQTLLEAQRSYLGGALPIKKYAFILYLYDWEKVGSGKMGALEHSYSSFYFLPEELMDLTEKVVDISAHEFFHILTPLMIHSEEIGDFDYIHPKMSKHLWLYEGVTEYFAGHVRVFEGLITAETYLALLKKKIDQSSWYNDKIPFTELSLGCLDEHKDQYGNVYQKGALIGLCLDILLREQSEGKMGMKDMMVLLSKEYGKDVSFKDELLFDKIAALSDVSIGTFFKKYVEDSLALPLADVFKKVGISVKRDVTREEITLGQVKLVRSSEMDRFLISDMENRNAFGKKMGYKKNDVLISINGVDITIFNLEQELARFREKTKQGDRVEVVVERKGKRKRLRGKAMVVQKKENLLVEFDAAATEEQLQLRRAWLGN